MAMKSNTVVIGSILIMVVNMLLVHFFQDEGLRCTYFRWVDLEDTKWQKRIIIKLDKENEELRNEIDNLRRETINKARRSEETERILKKFKKQS